MSSFMLRGIVVKKRDVTLIMCGESGAAWPSNHICKKEGEHWNLRQPIWEEFGPSS
jgi:hypothetical protein